MTGRNLLGELQDHFSQGPADGDVAHLIKTLEVGRGRVQEALLSGFLDAFLVVIRPVTLPAFIDDPRDADPFVQDVDDPSGFETLRF